MKKYFLMVAMLFAMNVNLFAEDNNTNETAIVNAYSVNVNTKSLGRFLDLSSDQYDAVETVMSELSSDLMFAAVECNSTNRSMVAKNAIDKNIKHMSYILNSEQYHKYLKTLNATIRNKKIGIIE